MCGICGSLSLGSAPVDPAGVRAMLGALRHRGPDSEGLFERPGVAAGIRRLAVIDVQGGDQPLANEDGTVQVVCNGEIYNFRELRGDLEGRGHRFTSDSDAEVLVHLWEEDGPALLERLNGMFAFCLHDARRRRTLIARDRLGIKPLFYFRDNETLVFASEPAALLRHPAAPREIDPEALVELFGLQYTLGDRTVRSGIRKLPAGHALLVDDGAPAFTRYYTIPVPRPDAGPGTARRVEELLELLDSSVAYRLIADVPLGLLLSGGLDSSALLERASSRADRPIQTFSVGFADAPGFDESAYARRVAERFGAEHHELVVSAVDIAEHLPRLVRHLAEPVTDPAMIPTDLLCEFARRSVTVALSGEGADELFGGYRRYAYQRRFGWLGHVPGAGRAGRAAAAGRLPHRIGQALEALAEDDPVRNHLRWSYTVGAETLEALFEPELLRAHESTAFAAFEGYFDGRGSRLGEQLRADQHEWLPHTLLAKVDRASMARSLEARVPYLDHRIVEWAARLPDAMKIRGGRTKLILRRAFEGRLPDEVLRRPKRGFDLPLGAWIRGPLRPLARDLLTAPLLSRWPGLRPRAAVEMLERHLREEQDFGLPLFNLLSVMIFFDQARRPDGPAS